MKIQKKKIHGKEARDVMLEGIREAANVIGSTMGAAGRNVVLDKEYGAPLVINDGITALREIFFDDPLKNMGVQLIKDASAKTNEKAGDGTSGTVVLARAIVERGWAMIEEGANPVQLRKEIVKAAEAVEEELKKQARTDIGLEEAIQIATVSVQDKELGEKIGKLMFEIGANGAVAMKNSLQRGVFIERDGGMRMEGALTGGVVQNPDKWESKLQNPRVLILRDSPEDVEFEAKWIPLMRQFADGQAMANGEVHITKVNVPQLLVVAEKLSRRFIMAMNQNKEVVNWVWFRPTTAEKNMKEIYKDLQSMVGGDIVHEEDGVFLSKMKLDQLGFAETALISRHELVITVNDARLQSDEYLDRCNVVKAQIDNAEDEIEQKQIQERYGNLTGGVAAIKVAAATEQDTNELNLRIEDAINATRSAMEEGYVAGGGVALYNAGKALKGATAGEKVVKEACGACVLQILSNAGVDDPEKLLSKLLPDEGVNVLTGQKVNMVTEGVIDPLKVIRLALINAVSVAGLLLTSEYVITNVHDDTDAVKKFFTSKE